MAKPLNKTNINKQVLIKIMKASRKALKQGYSEYVLNRKGEPFLRVKAIILNNEIFFEVLDKSNKNIAEILSQKALDTDIPHNLFYLFIKRFV